MLYPQQNDIRNAVDLSGFWEFSLDPGDVGESDGWFHGLSETRQIAVPGSWNEQFQDTRDYMDTAWYGRSFYVPSGWLGQDVFVRVGSANYHAKVWVNGELVGEHEGGHLPFDLEITSAVKWGEENRIAISVENKLLPTRVPPGNAHGAGMAAFMSNYPDTSYDFFPYGGLHRPVILWSAPKQRILDVTVVTNVLDGVGVVTVTAQRTGEGGVGRARLRGENVDVDVALAFGVESAKSVIQVPDARLWSPIDPYLYKLEVLLADRTVSDRYQLEIGIRTVQVQGDQLLLNGKPMFMAGFGKHEDFPVSGRGLNMPLIVKDISLFKWLGANSYRTSHYPYSDEAMQIADREGILIVDEIPAVGLVFADGEESIATRLTKCKEQLAELVARDKNHPSVIMWSVANEPMPVGMIRRFTGDAGGDDEDDAGTEFFAELYDLVHQLDPTRPATSAAVMGAPMDWMALSDVVFVNRYWGWYTQSGQIAAGAQVLAQELDGIHANLGKPIVISEFGADTIAGMHSDPPEMWTEEYQVEFLRAYLDVAAARPFVVGLHVWNFADFKTGQGTRRAGGLNMKGVFTRDRRPKMAAHFLRERWTSRPQPAVPGVPEGMTLPEKADPLEKVPEGIAALAQRLDGKNPGLTSTLKFDMGDKVFRIIFEDGACRAEAGQGDANATVSMSGETALKFFKGELNPMAAFMTGQIKIQGDFMALMALQKGMG